MITYDEIQGIYRAEKRSPNSLEKIDGNFYQDVLKFLSDLDESHRTEISNIVEEVFQIRRNKIIRLATRAGESSPPENMIPAERGLYDEIIKLLGAYRKKILLNENSHEEGSGKEISNQNPSMEKAAVEKVKLQMLRQMPSIIGSDLVHYGPFKENDVAELPKETARILIEKGIAEEVQAD